MLNIHVHSPHSGVLDGKIFYTIGTIPWYSCLEVNIQPDNYGQVGYRKSCVEGNCYQMKVYRLGPCFDDDDALAEYIYSKCPQITPPYPPVLNANIPTQTALDCIYKNRDLTQDSWYRQAYYKYIPKIDLQIDRRSCTTILYMNQEVWQPQYEVIGWCEGVQAYDQEQCQANGGTWVEEEVEIGADFVGWRHVLLWQHSLNNEEVITEESFIGCDEWWYGYADDWCECIGQWNAASLQAYPDVVAQARTFPNDRDNYNDNVITSYGIICANGEYQSTAWPGGCNWALDLYNEYKMYYNTVDLYVRKPPTYDGDANGVKIRLTITSYKGTANNCDYHAVQNGQSTTETDITVLWNEKIELPIANNMINYLVPTTPHCNSSEDYSLVAYQPPDGDKNACSNPQRITWSVKVLDYVK